MQRTQNLNINTTRHEDTRWSIELGLVIFGTEKENKMQPNRAADP